MLSDKTINTLLNNRGFQPWICHVLEVVFDLRIN
jgi:hypothetical protein